MGDLIADQNRVDFNQEFFCARHLGPCIFEGLNPLVAYIKVFSRLLTDPRFFEMCGGEKDEEGKFVKAPADANRIAAALNAIAPVCCYLGDAVVDEIWAEVRRDHARRCGH